MGKAIPAQHPAVVLRSHFKLVRALLAVAMMAVVGLTIALVIVANDEDQVSDTTSAEPIGDINYGGFNPATGRPESAPPPQNEHPLRSRIGNPATTPAPTSARAASVCGKAVEHPLCRRP